MKKTIYPALLLICLMFCQSSFSKSGINFDPKLKFKQSPEFYSKMKQKDLDDALKMHKKITNSFFGLSVDFQVGCNSTNANADAASSLQPVTTTSKGGFLFAAILNVNLFDVINFSTGLDFTKKNFGIQIPYYDSTTTVDSLSQDLSNSYLNIPLNVNFGGMVSEKVGVSFSGGPYLGILLNPTNAVSGFKDFDFGLNGILTGRYYLNPFVAIILGTSGQYGGLNNLLSSSSVDKLNTFNWGVFTGLNVGF